MWESICRCHMRRRLDFMNEAAEDASCNTTPTHVPTPLTPHLFTSIQSLHRYEEMWGKRRKPAGCFAASNLVGVRRKKHMGIVYTNGLQKCSTARQNMESEPLRERKTVLCLWCLNTCILLMQQPTCLTGKEHDCRGNYFKCGQSLEEEIDCSSETKQICVFY